MILINLLPHREEARKRREQQFYIGLGFAAVVGLLICAILWTVYQAKVNLQNQRNEVLTQAIAGLEKKIVVIKALRADIQSLQSRQRAVEDLQADRNSPVYLFNELVKQMPNGTYVTSIKQTGQAIAISGVAQSQERVSELLTNMARSEWFKKPVELIEIAAKEEAISAKEKRKVYGFTMLLNLVKPSDLQKAAEAATKKASAAG